MHDITNHFFYEMANYSWKTYDMRWQLLVRLRRKMFWDLGNFPMIPPLLKIWRCLPGHQSWQVLYLINLTVPILATFWLQISRKLLHISKTCTMQPRDKNITSFSLLFWFVPVGQVQRSEDICFFLQVLYFFDFYHHMETEAIFTHMSSQPKGAIFDLF